MKAYPAIELQSAATDLLLAMVDEFAPTAIEDRPDGVRIFFATRAARDLARDGLASHFDPVSIEVPDEDWARRSQDNLTPITVGRITIVPNSKSRASRPDTIEIVIAPSMGFGTGHHVTTRLCLAALQTLDLEGAFVLDVGTGSGVLAIAADRLGAARAHGIDFDPDAIQSARENLTLNPEVCAVTFGVADLGSTALPHAEVMTANLTGAVLARSAPVLLDALRPGGTIVLGGLQVHEREDVGRAFATGTIVWEREEDGWVGMAVKRR